MLNRQNKQRNGSTIFLILAAALFAGVIGYAFSSHETVTPDGVVKSGPVELSFSDVLRRAPDIKTMNIRGDMATGTLADGTKYSAVMVYNPELLEKFSKDGTAVSIDSSRGWISYLETWVPILMGVLFIWWIFRAMRGGAGGGIGRALM